MRSSAAERRDAPGTGLRSEAVDASAWLAIVAAGLLLTYLAVRLQLKVGQAGAPFTGRYRIKVEIGTVLAPLVAAAVLLAVRRGWCDTLSWRRLLWLAYAAAAVWALSLALVDGGNGLSNPVSSPDEYLPDVAAVGNHPGAFVRDFVSHLASPHHASSLAPGTRTHPPGPVLLLWSLRKMGVTRPLALGVAIMLIGCLSVPLVAIGVRSLCRESAARRLMPALVLAPYAIWLAVSMDAVTLTLSAAAVTAGVLASEPGRKPRWAIAGGVLFGLASLFSYSAGWLSLIPLLVCFLRRRGTTISFLGIGALAPITVARLLGFNWPDGLTGAQTDWSLRIGPTHSWLLWAVLDVVVLVMALGPSIVPAARRIRRTPGWPFVLGAGLVVVLAIGSGLARGEVERSWLPFFPWLLVPLVAPDVPDGDPPQPPLMLLALGALAAVVIESLLRTRW